MVKPLYIFPTLCINAFYTHTNPIENQKREGEKKNPPLYTPLSALTPPQIHPCTTHSGAGEDHAVGVQCRGGDGRVAVEVGQDAGVGGRGGGFEHGERVWGGGVVEG